MLKRTFLIVVILSVMALPVFAAGRADNQVHQAENPAGFTEFVDISDLSPGMWNFYMEARDMGGNVTVAGPHNIFIDPASDLPITQIVNPRPRMHVQGNLNIVGMSADDDGVAYTMLRITRGAGGRGELVREIQAQGTDFWSYLLDTSDTEIWQDGLYTVTAWAVDINGLSGISEYFPERVRRYHSVSWFLDRQRPDIVITSHELGAVTSGRTTIRGTVFDGNGVDSLSFSADNGDFQSVRLRHDRREDIYNFNFTIDTRNLEDGPQVINFIARDGMGTEGFLSFLIFVNNTPPDVSIVYPLPGESVSGIFSVAGYAMHGVGLSSLSWRLGNQSGEFDLLQGNPWWAKDFDIRGQNTRNVNLTITAVDISGNRTVVSRRLSVDQAAGMPSVNLTHPSAGMVLSGTDMVISGIAADNAGVASIFYSINGGTPVEVPTSGHFGFLVSDIPAGTNNLEVWARNIMNVDGPRTAVRGIVVPGISPEVTIDKVLSFAGRNVIGERYFHSGSEIARGSGDALRMRVNSGSPLQSLTYQIGSLPQVVVSVRGNRGGEDVHNIPIPANVSSGLVRVVVTATDIHGRGTPFADYIFVPGAAFSDDGQPLAAQDTFTWVRPNVQEAMDGRIFLSGGEPLVGFLAGRPLQAASIAAGSAAAFHVSVDTNGLVNVTGMLDGNFSLSLNLTDINGSVFTTQNYLFSVSTGIPSLTIMGNPGGQWVQEQVAVQFSMSSGVGVRSVDFSTDAGIIWQPLLQPNEIGGQSTFQRTISLAGIPDGAVNVSIRVTDQIDQEVIQSFTVHKDTAAPQARLIVPTPEASVSGRIRMGISIAEAGSIASITYQRPGSGAGVTLQPPISRQVYPDPNSEGEGLSPRFLFVELDETMPLSPNMSFVFTDMAGNTSVLSDWHFVIDEDALPIVNINLPVEDELVTADFNVAGIAFDNAEVARIFWRLNNDAYNVLDITHGFHIPIELSSLTDNEHSITIFAENIFGIRGLPVTRNFRVSLEEPVAAVTSPALGEIVGGNVRIAGVASDGNGIALVQVSLDNGNTFNNATGTTSWEYNFNSQILPDGTNVVFLRIFDNYGVQAIYSSMLVIDNVPPELVIESPADGFVTTGPLTITGQAFDNQALQSVVVRINRFDGVAIPANIAQRNLGLDSIIFEEMDLSALPDGSYNVEVWATDMAQNVTRASRNILLSRDVQRNFVEILYPLSGEFVQGYFNLYGLTGGSDNADLVTLMANGISVISEPVTSAGFFRFTLGGEHLREGTNTIVVRSHVGGQFVDSPAQVIEFNPYGPWVLIDTISMGDFVYNRPWIMGRAGYTLSEEDTVALGYRGTDRETRNALRAKSLDFVELSFDNGLNFFRVSSRAPGEFDWRHRFETDDIAEGVHFLIARATMSNGETALTRITMQIDNTPPMIRLISPQPGGRYNTTLEFSALATDDTELYSLSFHLRRGHWATYEIPGFMRGLYVEATIPPFIGVLTDNTPAIFLGGPTFFDLGLGLSFFDDNVKLQFNYGQMTQRQFEMLGGEGDVRYGGHVIGLKILANVYHLPFNRFLGPDWSWLSASLAIGANFSLFDVGRQGLTQSGNPTWLSALVAQLQFPRVSLSDRTNFRTFSLFTEGQLWFVPTDMDAAQLGIETIIPSVIMGVRMYIF